MARKHINWTNTLFLTITPLVALIGTTYLVATHQLHWQTWVLAGIFTLLTGLAVTGGYHRLFSHRTYKAHAFVKFLFLFFGAGAFEGSAIEWSTDHRNHHLYVDTEQDPYNINEGFFHAHIGWLIHLDLSKRDFSNVEDLQADPMVAWQHKHFVVLGFFVGFILPMLIAMSWGDALGGFILAGALRMTFNHHMTFCINSVCHMFGSRTYTEKQTARDNWFTALFTYGEGMHNFHHQFPLDYRNGIRAYHFDPTKWLIWTFNKLGLATDLRRITEQRIMRFKLQADADRLLRENDKAPLAEKLQQLVEPLRERIMDTLAHIEKLEADRSAFRDTGTTSHPHKNHAYRSHLRAYGVHLKAARRELNMHLAEWAALLRGTMLVG
ncbi:MAG: fatty acid desaturase [marine bacterium B5-7]|nr:MAG: fatty acid desaturase [marine bacterium B5-7]